MSCHSNTALRPGWSQKEMTDTPEVPVPVEEKPLVIIQTTANIPVQDLKRKFTENVEFHIDIDNSRLKNAALITYLSNLNIQVRLKFKDLDNMQALLVDYLRSTVLANIADLEHLAINVILAATGNPYSLPFDPAPFIEANYDLVDLWLRRLDSLPLYAYQCRPDTKDEVLKYPEDEDDGLAGLNFVKLIAHDDFPLIAMGIQESDWNWNKLFFNEYCFAGANLFHFYSTANNPFFLAMLGQDAPEKFTALVEQMNKTVKEIEHVPSA